VSEGDFLSRWSRRKHEARRGEPAPEVIPRTAAQEAVSLPAGPLPVSPAVDAPPMPLPPLESLTHDSDFAPFMQADVDSNVRRAALKTLFGDPRFNVMDGLDVYIDDYSKPDPLPEGWLEKLNQTAFLGHYQPPVEPEPGQVAVTQPQAEIEPGTEAAPESETPVSLEAPGDPIHPKAAEPASGECPARLS
jgi:hypothetical protein